MRESVLPFVLGASIRLFEGIPKAPQASCAVPACDLASGMNFKSYTIVSVQSTAAQVVKAISSGRHQAVHFEVQLFRAHDARNGPVGG